jgi:hypothetical protein
MQMVGIPAVTIATATVVQVAVQEVAAMTTVRPLLFILLLVPAMFVPLGYAHAQQQLYLYSYQDSWNSGWNHGLTDAHSDWSSDQYSFTIISDNSVITDRYDCASDHSIAFCDGYTAGYKDQWNIWASQPSPSSTTTQQQQCIINNSPGASCNLQVRSIIQGGN